MSNQNDKNEIGIALKTLRLAENLTLEELANQLNDFHTTTIFNKSILSKWERGFQEPKFSNLKLITDFFGIFLDELFDLIKLIPNRQLYENFNIIKFPHLKFKASAGSGNFYDDNSNDEYFDFNLIETHQIPFGATYTISVDGESMNPHLKNGDIVFINATKKPLVGEIGLFFHQHDLLIKEVGIDKLISTNPDYKDIIIDEDDYCFIRGTVVGILKQQIDI